MLATSYDILNIVLAICLVILTIFLSWGIYYFIISAHKIYKLVKRIEAGVGKTEEILDIARDKLKHSSAYFMILGEIAKKALSFVEEKKVRRRTRSTNQKK